jgi:hypothetical protein
VAALASWWFRKSKEDTEAMKRDLAHIKSSLPVTTGTPAGRR